VEQLRERRLGALPIGEAFDEVYRKKIRPQGATLSGLGSESPFPDRYIDIVGKHTTANKICIAVDGRYGDFSVGKRMRKCTSVYFWRCVSRRITAANIQRYGDVENIHFRCADLQNCALPNSNVGLIRQVFQHLTNTQIEQVLKNIESQEDWRRTLITEQVVYPPDEGAVNHDLPSHMVRIRVELGSRVFIDRPPFNRVAKRIALIDDGWWGKAARNFVMVFELVR